jgi:hypothetical protein
VLSKTEAGCENSECCTAGTILDATKRQLCLECGLEQCRPAMKAEDRHEL